jgi:hypothetical protein
MGMKMGYFQAESSFPGRNYHSGDKSIPIAPRVGILPLYGQLNSAAVLSSGKLTSLSKRK